jgi:deoxyribodipyrimidine photo-lyase
MEPGDTRWTATRKAGLARLNAFLPAAGQRYAELRNLDHGPQRENVSGLSPWLRRRSLTEPEVVQAVVAVHGLQSSAKFVEEVCWRSYWKGWLETRPSVWKSHREDVRRDLAALERDRSLERRYREAVSGTTGHACFDAWARELCETGYLHNHARMWFASIWCFTLELPWSLGADFFYRHLLDGDPASNTLSWRWVVGLHTPGKAYLATESNIARFTGDRFVSRVDGPRLALQVRPVAGEPNPPAGRLPKSDPMPSGRFVLLLTEEDLSPLRSDPRMGEAVAIAGVASDHRALGASTAVAAFEVGAMEDALQRTAVETGVPSAGIVPFTRDALSGLLREYGAEVIVTAYPPVGPVADRLAELALPVVRRMAPWDRSFWPYAQKGFFALRAEIPRLLSELGVGC